MITAAGIQDAHQKGHVIKDNGEDGADATFNCRYKCVYFGNARCLAVRFWVQTCQSAMAFLQAILVLKGPQGPQSVLLDLIGFDPCSTHC